MQDAKRSKSAQSTRERDEESYQEGTGRELGKRRSGSLSRDSIEDHMESNAMGPKGEKGKERRGSWAVANRGPERRGSAWQKEEERRREEERRMEDERRRAEEERRREVEARREAERRRSEDRRREEEMRREKERRKEEERRMAEDRRREEERRREAEEGTPQKPILARPTSDHLHGQAQLCPSPQQVSTPVRHATELGTTPMRYTSSPLVSPLLRSFMADQPEVQRPEENEVTEDQQDQWYEEWFQTLTPRTRAYQMQRREEEKRRKLMMSREEQRLASLPESLRARLRCQGSVTGYPHCAVLSVTSQLC